MTLNYDLIRILLLNIEDVSAPSNELWEPNLEDAMRDPDIYEHMEFLKETKLIKGTILPLGSDKQFAYRGIALTAKGYDFLNCCRPDGAWAAARKKIESQPSFTFEAFFEWMKSQADADFQGTENQESPKCPKCGRSRFETRHMKLESVGFGVLSVCCASCGSVVGVIDTKLHDKINEVKPQ